MQQYKTIIISIAILAAIASDVGSEAVETAHFHPKANAKKVTDIPVGLPESLDWRERGAVTEIKHQRDCSSWPFVVTGALEGYWKIKTGQLVPLSEQNLIDCSKRDMNCRSGWMNDGLMAIRDMGGINSEEAYGFINGNGKCKFNKSPGAVYAKLQSKQPVKIIKATNQALITALQNGPVMATLDGSRPSFISYTGGVYEDAHCEKQKLHDAVLIIGYGTDPESGKPYWLAKNTWGTEWGEQGYLRILRDSKNMCGILSNLSVPVLL